MKLSETGFEKLWEHFQSGRFMAADTYDKIEFEPDDFTGAVVLTPDEARKLVSHLKLCEVSVNDPFFASDCDSWAVDLCGRIGKAEKENG